MFLEVDMSTRLKTGYVTTWAVCVHEFLSNFLFIKNTNIIKDPLKSSN